MSELRGLSGQYVRYTVRLKEGGTFKRRFKGRTTAVNIDKTVAAVIANRMLEAAAAQLKAKQRRSRGTGALRKAILSEQNYRITDHQILMFRRAWLDKEVPYWRAIDQGLSVGFVGRILPGFFASGGEITRANAASAGQFRSYRRIASAGRAMRKAGVKGRPFIEIGRPIQPEGFVDAARRAFDDQNADALARGIIKQFGLTRD